MCRVESCRNDGLPRIEMVSGRLLMTAQSTTRPAGPSSRLELERTEEPRRQSSLQIVCDKVDGAFRGDSKFRLEPLYLMNEMAGGIDVYISKRTSYKRNTR